MTRAEEIIDMDEGSAPTVMGSDSGTMTDDAYYEAMARRLLADLSDYEYLRAEYQRGADRLTESYTRDSGCGSIRYDKIVAGRCIGGARPERSHEREIVRRDEIRRRMDSADQRMQAVDDMLKALDDRTRQMALDKYARAEHDVIMEERYDMTRQSIRRKIISEVAKYCKDFEEL